MRKDTGFENPKVPSPTRFCKLETELTFTKASLANQTNDMSLSAYRIREFSLQGGEFTLATRKWARLRSTSKPLTGGSMFETNQLEDFDRRRKSADLAVAKGRGLHKLLCFIEGRGRKQNGAFVCHLFHPARQMHRHSGGVVHLIQAALDRLDDDLAGMQTDANLQIRIV